MTTAVNRLTNMCSVTMLPSIASSCRVPVAQEDIVQPGRHHTLGIHEVPGWSPAQPGACAGGVAESDHKVQGQYI